MNVLFEARGLLVRVLVLGALGGVGLLLGYRFSKRGPIMFPIYGTILFVAALVIAQFPGLTFPMRFQGVMLTMLVATAIAMAGVQAAVQRRLLKRAQRGLPPIDGHAPWWSAPVVLASLAAASAAVAVLIR